MLANWNYVVIDTETGGLSCYKNPIMEVGLVVLNYKLEEVYRYETLVKNYNGLTYETGALKTHGISIEQANSKGKESKQVVSELINIFKSYTVDKFKIPVLVGHNVKFDIDFISYLFNYHGKVLKDTYVDNKISKGVVDNFSFDTMWLSRQKWGDDNSMPNHQLVSCCDRAGVQLINAHGAVNDVLATAELFKYFISFLKSVNFSKSEEVKFRSTFEF